MRQLVENKHPSLIFLTETHIVEAEAFNQYSIPGYKVSHCLSHSRHTGGVAIYAKESIVCEVLSNEFCENNWFLGLSVVKGIKMSNYGMIYHSPSSSDNRFLQILENWMEEFLDLSKFNILAGDFNINWFDIDNSKHLKQLVGYLNLHQTVNEFTRISKNSRTLIDHVFSNSDTVRSSTNVDLKITDHETIVINIEDSCSDCYEKIKIKCWKKYSMEAMSELVKRSLDFHTLNGTLDQQAAVLTNILKTCTGKLVCEKFIDLPNSNSWYNFDLLHLKRERDELYIQFRRSNCPRLWKRYTIARNKYCKSLKNARSEYIQRKIDQNKNNSKELWKILKRLINSKIACPRSITFEGINEDSEQIISSKFNDFFVNSVSQINQSIEFVREPDEIKFLISNKFDDFRPITYLQLKEICFSLESARIDNVNARVIQDCFHVIGHPLLNLINQSLETGHVPQAWKESLVIPIPKVAGTVKADEFRPINMLHTLEKILEIVVKGQLLEYLKSNDLLIPEQSGYREAHSCETALNLVLAKCKRNSEEKKPVTVALLCVFEAILQALLLRYFDMSLFADDTVLVIAVKNLGEEKKHLNKYLQR